MSGALCIYLWLTGKGNAGSGGIAIAILLSMFAAALQASKLTVTLLVPLDHNGLFHLVQMAAIVILGYGLRASLRGQDGSS